METNRNGTSLGQAQTLANCANGNSTVGKSSEQRVVISASTRPVKRERSKVTANGMTYADWLTKAIDSSPDKRLTLSEIYDWMVLNVNGLSGQRYLHSSKGWKNAVRHTLSVNARFCKIARPGRPSFWALTPSNSPESAPTVEASKKRTTRTVSSSTSPSIFEGATNPKRLKCVSTPSDPQCGHTSSISTTSVTPPARTPQVQDVPNAEPSISRDSDPAAPYYTLEYYQIPLAMLAAAATATHAFTPKPTSNFRTSPTSAFVSFGARQEAKG